MNTELDELQEAIYNQLRASGKVPYTDEGVGIIYNAVKDFTNTHELIEVAVPVFLPWYKKLVNFFYPVYDTETKVLRWKEGSHEN